MRDRMRDAEEAFVLEVFPGARGDVDVGFGFLVVVRGGWCIDGRAWR